MLEDIYNGYSATDFLKDEGFLRWNLLENEEDNAYWSNLLEVYPELVPVVKEAIALCKTQIRLNDYSLRPEEIETYHDLFYQCVAQRRKRKVLYYWISTAASLLLLFAVTQLYNHQDKQESTLLDFVKADLLPIDLSSKDIQLFVSSGEMIRIEENAPDIVYNSDSILVTGKSVAGTDRLEYSRLVVPRGKRSNLSLADGTVLHVNSGTKVVYPNQFIGDIREIYVNGEVFLDVAANSEQPFVVRTDEMAIRVLGTKFNVMNYEDDAETHVVLASGLVQITLNENSKETELSPSQMYNYKEGEVSVTQVDVEKYISWIHGILYAEDETLDILMTKLSRYYGEEIVFDEEIMNQRWTGKVDLKNDLGEVLDGLTFSFPIKIEQNNNMYNVRMK